MGVFNVTQAISSSMMTVLLNAVDNDAAAGYIEFYTGSMPAKPESAPTGDRPKALFLRDFNSLFIEAAKDAGLWSAQ